VIHIRGARRHNLQDLNLEIPSGALVVICGPSGSGKSTLALEVICAEGRRRYLASLGAPQLLEDPEVESIEGLTPTVALRGTEVPPGTVGSLSELAPMVRQLLAYEGTVHCPTCGGEVAPRAPHGMAMRLLEQAPREEAMVLAPWEGTLEELRAQGFLRLRLNGRLLHLEGISGEPGSCEVVVDRLRLRPDNRQRLAESLEVALRLGRGIARVLTGERRWDLCDRWRCPTCGRDLPEPAPGLFSPRSPRGACPSCRGRGCPECEGSGLRAEARCVELGGRRAPEVLRFSLRELREWLEAIRAEHRPLQAIRAEALRRLGKLLELGLGGLELDRPLGAISRGELQRLRLALCLLVGLGGVTYVLDEPTVGLHAQEVARLVELLRGLRRGGNTVLVVEHHPALIAAADWLVELGPGAGSQGGRLVYAGPPAGLPSHSPTGSFLHGAPPPRRLRRRPTGWAAGGGLRLPLGVVVGLCGPSGSGKTRTLHALRTSLGGIILEQSPLGASARSTPATYLGVTEELRRLWASLPESRARGYGPEHFSFNLPQGWCPGCRGEGVVRVELGALPPEQLRCEACGGRRYRPEVLEVRYRGKNLGQVLEMTLEEATEFFSFHHHVQRLLRPALRVGLGYLRLGQPAGSLSAGEAQRLRLARILGRSRRARIWLLDEPTVGLHPWEVECLVEVLEELVERGHTVVVAEHDLRLLAAADWLVELGGEGSVIEGTPEQLAQGDTLTGRWLRSLLEGAHVVRPQGNLSGQGPP